MQDFQLLLTEPSDGILELTLIGELDMATAEPLGDATRTAAASGDYHRLIFNLTRLTFIDSSGLHTLTTAHREMRAKGGTTKIVCDSSNLIKLFELTGLNRVLPIVSNRDEAIAVGA